MKKFTKRADGVKMDAYEGNSEQHSIFYKY